MEIGIVGLPKSGKTTIFNALTGGKADTSAYISATEPNIGVARVQDSRIQELQKIYKPKKIVTAEIKYVDFPMTPQGMGKGEGIGGQFLAQLSRMDALLYVIRAFKDDNVPHITGSINPLRDISTLDLELAFSDLAIIERRLKRIEDSLKGARASERDNLIKEKGLLERVKKELEQDKPLYSQQLSEDESRTISNFQFLTAKPVLLVLNIGENDVTQSAALEKEILTGYKRPGICVTSLCGKIELELSQLADEEAVEFRNELGFAESGTEKVGRLSYDLLGLVTFFTTASNELRAWAASRNSTAPRAAGKVHTDMEHGFIRAEVISYKDIISCGTIAEARKKGLLRLEGKSYLVQDGDVITFLFNV